jgi:ankyrin repeat protein
MFRVMAVAGIVAVSVGAVGAVGAVRAAGDLRLVEAVKKQNKEAVRTLLAEKVDVNATEGDGATALHWAAYQDDLDSAEMLLHAGANAGAANEYGVTPLSLACTNANAAMVEKLLAAGVDAKTALKTGETALMTCARTGSEDAVLALLGRGADPNVKEPLQNQTALMWAVAAGHPAVVRALVEHKADVRARSRVSRNVISRRLQSELKYGELGRKYGTDAEETSIGGFTPLLFAARHGNVESARLLLAAGAGVNDTAPDGASVLLVATHSNHWALAKFLLEQGANPNAATAGYAPLHAAVLTGDVDVVKALLAHGARPNAQVTLATRVVRNGQVLMLGEHLLGATPFALAAKFAEPAIMRVLTVSGADAALPLKNGWTPLMLAAGASWRYGTWDRHDRALRRQLATEAEMHDEPNTLEVVRLAFGAGADIDAVDQDGNSVLHHVVDKAFNTVVEFLVEKGANVNVRNNRGLTPLGMITGRRRAADEEGFSNPKVAETANLLRKLGAQ